MHVLKANALLLPSSRTVFVSCWRVRATPAVDTPTPARVRQAAACMHACSAPSKFLHGQEYLGILRPDLGNLEPDKATVECLEDPVCLKPRSPCGPIDGQHARLSGLHPQGEPADRFLGGGVVRVWACLWVFVCDCAYFLMFARVCACWCVFVRVGVCWCVFVCMRVGARGFAWVRVGTSVSKKNQERGYAQRDKKKSRAASFESDVKKPSRWDCFSSRRRNTKASQPRGFQERTNV